jgi:hypothetical protein
MRMRSILALAVCCLAAYQGQAALARSPLAWLGFGSDKSPAAKTTEVSQKSHTPAVFAKMTDGTKRFVGSTKKMFVPAKAPVKRRGVTATHHAQKPEPPKQNFFKRLFSAEPPPPPKTVNEWMSLDHVHP